MDRPLRLIPADPLDKLARTVEALLVVSSTPLSVEEVSVAAEDDPERVEAALRLVADRFAEERSGIVLEHVAGGWAFRAGREEAGGKLVGVWVTLGRYDVVEVFEAPDDDTALEIVTKLSHHGAEQTETLRAFTRDEAEEIIKKL